MEKRKLRPWVKIVFAFLLGVTIVSQVSKASDSQASEVDQKKNMTKVLHGVVEMYNENNAYLTIIEEQSDTGSVEIRNQTYQAGDIITVLMDGNDVVIDSFRSTEKEIEQLENNHGAVYAMLLMKHGKSF